MPALRVVEAVAPLDHNGLGLASAGEVVSRQYLPFQAGEERLRGGIDAPIAVKQREGVAAWLGGAVGGGSRSLGPTSA